jgi:cyclic pyranopterin phosphate synthase
MIRPVDTLQRPLRSLRLSVTDRCNLRCHYCMPEAQYVWIPHEELLHFEEISALVDVFVELGVAKLRLTGGEPLVRRDLPALVRMLAAKPGLHDLALTTNGVLLASQAQPLAQAGLQRVTVSVDTLRPERFRALTGCDALSRVLEGIAAARRAGLQVKLNAVIVRGFNDDELVELLLHAQRACAEVRFIEYMDVGGATRWSRERVLAQPEILDRLRDHYGPIRPVAGRDGATAEQFILPNRTRFAIIASTTNPFCSRCDRSRLTADGVWYQCLYARTGVDLKQRLRQGAGREALAALIASSWRQRTDRAAQERLGLPQRGPFAQPDELRRDYHLEMHTRGG